MEVIRVVEIYLLVHKSYQKCLRMMLFEWENKSGY
ncbi:MAG: hypothetical protein Harvfovirus10_21 [Harvfovirus sp.]|uniref:Uncharacterized protein n=1 Tax=Harvfovirus sp. TaxID=2487768 RepID=A0A3G5A526_9VIRU|nr:MAG: hypothetical protein Harvfovirus10_21 [Harvfovirus sp.]